MYMEKEMMEGKKRFWIFFEIEGKIRKYDNK